MRPNDCEKCQKCSSERIAQVNGKVSDMYWHTHKDKEYSGYVSPNVPWCSRFKDFATTDYIGFFVCLDCGQMQGEWPVQDKDLGDDEEENS